ncbi:hypothetical protein A2335_01830 [Candidatus Peregrinibacteria bacterium RIFOXYB2_FULL_32_7]|nr:MAG: hypothetical protein A2335_01830 [Candidatus Peregrinibacteria bacterium RIFOXYB2_FULL_32_7]
MTEATTWESLPPEKKDLFANPHCYGSSEGYKTPGYGLRDRTLQVINELDEDGRQKALAVLDKAIRELDKYGRSYLREEVEEIREKLQESLKS